MTLNTPHKTLLWLLIAILFSILMIFLNSCSSTKKITKKINNACELCDSLRPKKITDSVTIVRETTTKYDTVFKSIFDTINITTFLDCPDVPKTVVEGNRSKLTYEVKNKILKIDCSFLNDSIEVLNRTIENLEMNSHKSEMIADKYKDKLIKRPLNTWLLLGNLFFIIVIIAYIYLKITNKIYK